MPTIRVGSRESELAVIQARFIVDAIRAARPGTQVELVTMKTAGDKILKHSLAAVGGKGLFTKELDDALRRGDIDLAVHSYKDMTVDTPADLPVVAVSRREDPRDVLVLPEGADGIAPGKPVGTSSPRRQAQFARLFPGHVCTPVRGNIQTRLRKLDTGGYAALILAAAGLNRLGLGRRASRIFTPEEMLPAACQGMLAVQGRAGEDHSCLAGVDDADSRDAAAAERGFVAALGAGCADPVAAHAVVTGGRIRLAGMYINGNGEFVRGTIAGARKRARALGAELAARLREGKDGDDA